MWWQLVQKILHSVTDWWAGIVAGLSEKIEQITKMGSRVQNHRQSLPPEWQKKTAAVSILLNDHRKPLVFVAR